MPLAAQAMVLSMTYGCVAYALGMERRNQNVHDAIRCGLCRQWMQAGFVSVSQGLLWLRNAEGSAVDFAESLPGTNAIMRANRLPAWRCLSCEIVSLRYGREVHKYLPAHRYAEAVEPEKEEGDEKQGGNDLADELRRSMNRR